MIAEIAASLRAASMPKSRTANQRPPLKMPDALILATAEHEPGIDQVIAGDARWPAVRLTDVRVIALEGRPVTLR